MGHHVPWVIKYRRGMKQRINIEHIVGGRRPHGLLHFIDEVRMPRALPRAAPSEMRTQAALASSCWTLLGVPSMAMRRGFMASGICRSGLVK
jgi:hypothetical protein